MKIFILELCGSLLLLSLLGMLFKTFPSILKNLGVPEAVVGFLTTPSEWITNIIAVFFVVGVAGTVSGWLAIGLSLVLLAVHPKLINDLLREMGADEDISITARGFMAVIGIIFVGRWLFALIGWIAIAVVAIAMVAGYLYKMYRKAPVASPNFVPEGDSK